MSRRVRQLAAAVIVSALLAGCAASPSPGGPARRVAEQPPLTEYVTGCSLDAGNSFVVADSSQAAPTVFGAGRHGGALPAGFVPVAVIGCGLDREAVPGDGVWQVATQTRAEGSPDDLVTAYRMPAPEPGRAATCSLNLDLDPMIAFVDAAGTAVWPAPPRDPVCDHISPRVTRALAGLHWTVTNSRRLQRLATSP